MLSTLEQCPFGAEKQAKVYSVLQNFGLRAKGKIRVPKEPCLLRSSETLLPALEHHILHILQNIGFLSECPLKL